jgi:hypothetical protein
MEQWQIARRFTRKRDYTALRPVITAVDGGHGNPQQRGNPLHQRLREPPSRLFHTHIELYYGERSNDKPSEISSLHFLS